MRISILYTLFKCLTSPLDVMFTLFIFILSKNLGASPQQLAIVAMIKPVSSLFAYYASSFVFNKAHRVRPLLIGFCILGAGSCFLYPFIDNVWYYVVSYALFMITSRAAYPLWMEMIKLVGSKQEMSRIVSRTTIVFYAVTLALPPLAGVWMDNDPQVWRFIFLALGLLQVSGVALILMLNTATQTTSQNPFNLKSVLDPLKQSWDVLKENRPFVHYILLAFIGGVPIIALQPILPFYFKDELNISYTQLAMAFSFCKAIGSLLTTPVWARFVNRITLFRLNAYIAVFTGSFLVFLLLSHLNLGLLYVAYIFYGVMHSGCDFTWNLSGPFFAGKKDSTIFSAMNLIMVGIRGCICPGLGLLVYSYSNAHTVFLFCLFVSILVILYGVWLDRRSTNKAMVPV